MRLKILTIIVPAYNVERYINQCLNSLLNQTVKNFQVVLINDGSTDGTADICQRYAFEHSELFRYISQSNKGLGAARNAGLAEVDTPYVSFLDSDDWQDIRFVEKFCKLLDRLDYEPDMIFTLPRCYNEASRLLQDWMDKPLYTRIFGVEDKNTNKSINSMSHSQVYVLEVNANRKIYRTDFLRDNQFAFPEGVKWEDIRPHVQLCHQAKSMVALPDTGFIYRTNNAGQITAGTGVGRLDIIRVFEDLLNCVSNGLYNRGELSAVMELICRYSYWMIDMTNMDYIDALLDGLHGIYAAMPDEMLSSFYDGSTLTVEEKNRAKGLIRCLRSGDYHRLADYDERKNLYRYWSMNGGKKKNIIGGGIQCIRDSGLKYTVKLFIKKLLLMRA